MTEYSDFARGFITHKDPAVKKLAFIILVLERDLVDNRAVITSLEYLLRKLPGFANEIFSKLNLAKAVIRVGLTMPNICGRKEFCNDD